MSITEMNSPHIRNDGKPATTADPRVPAQPGMNAAQMQALQEAARKLGEDVSLRKWCVERAIEACGGVTQASPLMLVDEGKPAQIAAVHVAEQIHRFIVGQSSSTGS